MRKTFTAIALVAFVALVAGPVTAGGRSSIQISQGTLRTDGVLNFGDTVAFDIVSPYWDSLGGRGPWVHVTCRQAGVIVSQQSHGYFEGYYLDSIFALGPTNLWESGAASCQADLGHWSKNFGRFQVEASLGFNVAA